jgi:hypothetical protein
MTGKDKERWTKLCERAANEQDPKRMLELVSEIIKLLDAKEKRLKNSICARTSRPAFGEQRTTN